MLNRVVRRIASAIRTVLVAPAMLSVLGLTLAATPSTAPKLLANGLIMGGTLMPDPSKGWRDMMINDFVNPTVEHDVPQANGTNVVYPASAGFPPILVPTINKSVQIGADNLDAAIAVQPPGESIVAFGFSQSTVSTMIEKTRLSQRKANGEAVPDVNRPGSVGGSIYWIPTMGWSIRWAS